MAAGLFLADGEEDEDVRRSSPLDGAQLSGVAYAVGEDTALPPVPASSTTSKPWDEGVPMMTPDTLRECCMRNEGWSQPKLNDRLVLHFKGFQKIERLEAYYNVKSLFLECNGIRCIENLESLPGLVSIYLHSNCVARIENLQFHIRLRFLNLAHNSISRIENLGSLLSLETLNVASNKIVGVEGLLGLAERPTLSSVNVAQNYIEDGEGLLDFFEQALPEIQCLYLQNNPCSRSLKDHRRRLVCAHKKLRYLDERPVFEVERVGCEAWLAAGKCKQAEQEAKRAFWNNETNEKARSFEAYQHVAKAARQRHQAIQEWKAEHDVTKARVADEFRETGYLPEGWVLVPKESTTAAASGGKDFSRKSAFGAKAEAFLAGLPHRQASCLLAPEVAVVHATDLAEAESEVVPVAFHVFESPALEDNHCEEEAATEFVWTKLRDNRLGRLVAEKRFNFLATCAALIQEFPSDLGKLTADLCRKRYRELVRPRSTEQRATQQAHEEERQQKPSFPQIEGAAVAASDWFLRKVTSSNMADRMPMDAAVSETKSATTSHTPVMQETEARGFRAEEDEGQDEERVDEAERLALERFILAQMRAKPSPKTTSDVVTVGATKPLSSDVEIDGDADCPELQTAPPPTSPPAALVTESVVEGDRMEVSKREPAPRSGGICTPYKSGASAIAPADSAVAPGGNATRSHLSRDELAELD